MADEWTGTIFEAARAGRRERVWAMLDAAPARANEVDDRGATLLHVAAERDDVPLALGLLERSADPSLRADWGQTPFEWAANMNSNGVATLLLERGAGRLDLWTAAALGMLTEVERYFAEGPPATGSGRRPVPGSVLDHWPEDCAFMSGDELSDAFYIACRNGRREVADFLLTQGAYLNATGYFGATALHWAAGRGRREVVVWLLEQGADPELRDPEFSGTAAGWAREFGHMELAAHIEAHIEGMRSE